MLEEFSPQQGCRGSSSSTRGDRKGGKDRLGGGLAAWLCPTAAGLSKQELGLCHQEEPSQGGTNCLSPTNSLFACHKHRRLHGKKKQLHSSMAALDSEPRPQPPQLGALSEHFCLRLWGFLVLGCCTAQTESILLSPQTSNDPKHRNDSSTGKQRVGDSSPMSKDPGSIPAPEHHTGKS